MKNTLAENLLRFGAKNLDQTTIDKLASLSEQAKSPSGTVTIPYKQTYNLAAGKFDASSYINEMLKGIMGAINSNPEAKKMLDNKSIKLIRASFQGGASNSWGGQDTGVDLELNNTKATPTETVLYQKNKDLAAQRAEACKTALLPLLEKSGIKLGASLPTNTFIASAVYNTGGKLDLAGQVITVRLTFSYLSVTDIITITDIKPTFIAHGSYYTKDGKSSRGTMFDPASLKTSTSALPPQLKAMPNRLAAFEVKWNPGVLKDPLKIPWYRWLFVYDEQGKIKQIIGKVYDTTLNANLRSIFKDNDNIPTNDPTLKYMMDLVSANYYNTYFKPFV